MKEQELREKLKNNMGDLLDGLRVFEVRENVPIGRGKAHALADMVVTVKVGNQRRRLVMELKQRAYPSDLDHGILKLRKLHGEGPALVPVLVAPFISESGRRQVRMHKINYLDLSGNVHIAFDNVLINRASPGNAYVRKKQGINIFADKASLVLRELAAKPDEYQTVRGLAEKTSSSVGWTSEVLREVEERGYLDRKPRGGCKIRRLEYLLDDWTDNYNFLGKNSIRGFFLRAEGLEEILGRLRMLKRSSEVDYALTLHSGAYLVAPFVQYGECHLYVGGRKGFERQIDYFVKALNLLEPATGGNFHIVRPYYEMAAFYKARVIEGLEVVSDLQLYLDLFRFPTRGREAAEKVLEHSDLLSTNSRR